MTLLNCSIDVSTRKKDAHQQHNNMIHTSGSHQDLGLTVEVPSSGDEEHAVTGPARTHEKST